MGHSYFEEGDIKITSNFAAFGDTSYPIHNIGAIKVAKGDGRDDGSAQIGCGSIVVIFFVIVWFGVFGYEGTNGGTITILGGSILAGVLVIKQGLDKSEHLTLVLRTSSGNQTVHSSKDHDKIREIERALEVAISARD